MVLIWYSLDAVMAVKMDVTTSSAIGLSCNLTTLVGNLFYHYLTYLDVFIGRRITEDYSI
jgi:uncharacterized membrane protein